MRFLILATLAVTSACASGSVSHDDAVTMHNVLRQVIIDADAAYAPVLAEALAKADAVNPGDDLNYESAVAPWKAVTAALTAAKIVEQAMRLSLVQWTAAAAGSGVEPETFACAAGAMTRLANAFGQLPAGSALYSAAFVVSAQLRSMADGSTCHVGAK